MTTDAPRWLDLCDQQTTAVRVELRDSTGQVRHSEDYRRTETGWQMTAVTNEVQK